MLMSDSNRIEQSIKHSQLITFFRLILQTFSIEFLLLLMESYQKLLSLLSFYIIFSFFNTLFVYDFRFLS